MAQENMNMQKEEGEEGHYVASAAVASSRALSCVP